MHADMSVTARISNANVDNRHVPPKYLPLQIIRSRILVFAIRTERTHIARRLMHEAVTYHFVFALEAFSAFGARTAGDGAVVGSILRVDVCVRAMRLVSTLCLVCFASHLSKRRINLLEQILCLKRKRIAVWIVASKSS
jgi:hypothetical protein